MRVVKFEDKLKYLNLFLLDFNKHYEIYDVIKLMNI
jgi:hypothetical protein